MYTKKLLFPKIDLQLFAENPETDPTGNESDTVITEQEEQEVKTFTQDEVDNLIKGRLAKERKSWEKHMQEQQTEAEKLASMSEKDKKAYTEKKQTDDLAKREAAITRRELTAQAKDQLADKGLPIGLAEVLNYTDAESCNASIEAVSSAFQQAVEKAVEERIKGGPTMKKASSQPQKELEDEIYKNMKGA